MQALYADVPMSVSVPGLQGGVFQATQGLKQGCPLSPTLFSLYIDDFEQRMITADSGGAGFDLPALVEGCPAPQVLYADDMALLATSARGLQAQFCWSSKPTAGRAASPSTSSRPKQCCFLEPAKPGPSPST